MFGSQKAQVILSQSIVLAFSGEAFMIALFTCLQSTVETHSLWESLRSNAQIFETTIYVYQFFEGLCCAFESTRKPRGDSDIQRRSTALSGSLLS